MPETTMLVPMPLEMCVDLIRFSDGQITPEKIGEIAADQISLLLATTFDPVGHNWFGRHALEAASKFAPDYAANWVKEDDDLTFGLGRPLVWKEITVPDGSGVRMQYGGEYHFAEIRDGQIKDKDGIFTPSEWASKVAGGTSRNAWRDIWFREGASLTWIPAQMMRDQARLRMGKK